MRLLLDSHAVYWWMIGSVRLSETARELILNDANSLLVSAVSIYEIELKAKRGRVELPPQELRAAPLEISCWAAKPSEISWR